MALIEIAAAAGILYTGVRTRRQRTRQQGIEKLKRTVQRASVWARTQTVVHQLDTSYQTFIKQRLDPLLLGKKRRQQLAALADKGMTVKTSELEKITNRRIGLASIILGTALLNAMAVPGMFYAMIGLAVCSTWQNAIDAYQDTKQKHKITLNVITVLYLGGMWFAGYFVFGSAVLILFSLTTKLRFVMEHDSRDRLHAIFGQQPRVALRVIDGVELEVSTDELQVGDRVVVNAGEALPVDGLITEGLASIDQQTLTGEAQPVEKQPGDPVFAGTLVLSGRVFVEVEKAGYETTANRIGEILIETAEHRTAIESKGTVLADKGALPTLMVGLVAWPVVGITGAIAALGAGFGYNLRTVSILSTFNYLQIAAQHAILIKDARALEQLCDVDTFVFDKTGTLTQEIPSVGQFHLSHPDHDENTLLTYAAAAEYRQTHPIAKAILAAAEARELILPTIDEARYEVGYGIKVTVNDQLIRVGSQRFMQMEGIEIPETIQQQQTVCQQKGHSLVMVAVNEQLMGAIELHTTLRPEIETVLSELRQRGNKLVIISGDQTEPTRMLAEQLGIDDYFANTLPENKATLIEQLQQAGRTVCFIGDGMNDAIALQQADVGISLSGATTIATDAAQIVLMEQGLARLPELLALSRQFDRTMHQGFWSTMIPGMVCVGGVFFLHFGIVASELLFQLGFLGGIGVAMKPLWDAKQQPLLSRHKTNTI